MEADKTNPQKLELKNKIIQGDTLDVLRRMPNDVFDTIITSPPY